MRQRRKPVMGLLFGETAGIGPELIIKALQVSEVRQMAVWVLIGDERVCKLGQDIAGLTIPYKKIQSTDEIITDEASIWMIDLKNIDPNTIQMGTISQKSGKITGETLKYALELALDKKLDGIVYAPVNKEALHKGGLDFNDEIHFFADTFNCLERFGEINVMENLWVTRVTSHVPIKEVSGLISKKRVGEIIRFANANLIRAGFKNPSIAVCALNPHGGDGGLIGREEIDEIIPAINEAKQQGLNVAGPYPADTIFLRLQNNPIDCLVGMYHDQVQTGMKLLGFHKGVTISGGLPVVITTPAHGTAFDIVGRGIANPGAQMQAMKLAVKMVQNNLNS
ncbi:4-hydroxythreonine-4-phosphate dehydrogenase PdxA [Desulfitibacter alkalitolerans]|uniref:4-hydroxythreonine-4-phosphate dehydrogenase PdxA n=1 Tax=Desulfitibacter alkalitolerans TaxID=264641 RepID=UPI0004896D0F|nr:4-hydroxythreonine-4-phosphate dehydrogenase PdxA [Desulfitibacter alkalitolerans]